MSQFSTTVRGCTPRATESGYIARLSDIEADNPTGDIFIITDNLSSHSSVETRTWLEEHPRIHHVFIPSGAGSAHSAGGLVATFPPRCLAGQSFANPNEIEQATRVATKQLNLRAKAWAWGRPRHPITATTADFFVIAFNERSTSACPGRLLRPIQIQERKEGRVCVKIGRNTGNQEGTAVPGKAGKPMEVYPSDLDFRGVGHP
jgi:hypothetical protein